MNIFRKSFTIALPKGAKVFDRDGETWARWRGRGGKTRECRVIMGRDGSRRAVQMSKTWTMRYTDHTGIEREESTGQTDRGLAEIVAADRARREERIGAGVLTLAEDRMTTWAGAPLSVHIADYLDGLRDAGRTPRHIGEVRAALEATAAACSFDYLRDMNREALERHLASRRRLSPERGGIGARSSNKHATYWKSFASWAVAEKRLANNPFAGLRRANEDVDRRHERRALSEAEVEALLEAAARRPLENALRACRDNLPAADRQRLAALGEARAFFYRFLVETGMRYGEAKSLLCSQVRLDHDPPFIELAPGATKNRRGGRIPLHGDLAEALGKHIAGRVSRDLGQPGAGNVVSFEAPDPDPRVFDVPLSMVAPFVKDLQAAGIAKRDRAGRVVDLHSLRATFATRHARAGTPPQVLQRLMRHSTPHLTMRHYVHLDLGDLGAAVEALPAMGPRNLARNLALAGGISGQYEARGGATVTEAGCDTAAGQSERIGNKDAGRRKGALSGIVKCLVSGAGLEPAATGLKVRCSTT